jgi:glycine/D-amino acid oxidase-like deaminating enzyme/nitrite reductase/ring-hydroxylating ferredoxin subunit
MTRTSADCTPSQSPWLETVAPIIRAPLTSNVQVDVCVVGGGIAGLSTAYLLANEGASVALLERAGVGSGETGRTTAHLTWAMDEGFCGLERLVGSEGARVVGQSHRAAVDCIEAIVARERIDCDFERLDGYLFAPPYGERQALDEECAAAQRAGITVEYVSRAPLLSFDTGPCLRFPGQGQFHPMKYLRGMVTAFEAAGGRLFTGTHVDQICGGSTPCARTAGGAGVCASAIVVATNTPIHDNLQVHFKQAPFRTYVVGLTVPRDSVARALYWDTPHPYHYVRVMSYSSECDLLVVGGEDHRTGEEDDGVGRFATLEEWARVRFPAESVAFRWSGQVMEAVDGIGLIGRDRFDQPNVFIATGDSGQGITHGTVAAMLLRDLILGRSNPWASVYDPTRFPVQSAEFLQDGADTLWHYAEWFTSGDVDERDAIGVGEGAVVRDGLEKFAVYRDESGHLHERSAVCSHLGCIVAWNSVEKMWHCSCHGSRYLCDGRVVGGPARSNLT